MSKKTWSTILVVVLVVAAAVGIYFATRTPAPAPAPTEVVSEAPAATDVPATDAPATDVPATDVPVTDAPAAEATEAATAAESVAAVAATAEAKVAETVEAAATVAAQAEQKVEETVAQVEEKAAEVAATAEAKVEEAVAAVSTAAADAKEEAGEVVAAAETKAGEAAATVGAAVAATEEKVAQAVGADKVQVVVWHTFTEDQEKSLSEIAAAYSAENPGVEVLVQSQPRQGFLDKVFNAVRTKTGPNMIINFSSEAAKYIDPENDENTYVIDFQQYMNAEELEAFKASLPAAVYDETVIFEDGKMHIIPVYTSGPILFYNATWFEELGLEAPNTWEELETVARAIKDKHGVPGFAVDSLTDLANMLMMQSGAPFVDVENKKALFDDTKAVERVQWFADLVKEGVFTLTPTGDYFSNDFNSQLIGSYFGSVAGLPYIQPNGFEFGVAPSVMDGVKWYPAWNRGAIAFKVSEEADKATYDFIRYFTNAENSSKFTQSVVSLSPYAATIELPEYQAYLNAEDDMNAEGLRAVQAHLQDAGVLPIVSVSATIRTEIERAITRASTGEATAADALKEAVETVNSEWASY